MADEEEDFGGGPMPEPVRPTNVIPFHRQKPDGTVIERWEAEAARSKTKHRYASPLDAMAELERKRKLPRMPLPWEGFASRAVMYPGDMMGVSGPTGGGKTSFAIEIARHAIGLGIPVLWLPLELDESQVNLRIVANMSGTHMAKVRDEWSGDSIRQLLIQLNDRWRYVDLIYSEWEGQLAALRTAVQIAKKVHGRPPLWIIDYIGKLARGGSSGEIRSQLANAIEWLRRMTVEEECFGMALAQTSRSNNNVLTGKVDLESAADAIGVSAETSELDHAVSVNVALNVFKADDAPSLDSHVLVTKARNSGKEGREGFRFHKPGGRWEALSSLPATPGEVTKELAAAKKDRRVDASPETVRAGLNQAKATEAELARSRTVFAALKKLGVFGAEPHELIRLRGVANVRNVLAALELLLGRGVVEQMNDGRWRVTTQGEL